MIITNMRYCDHLPFPYFVKVAPNKEIDIFVAECGEADPGASHYLVTQLRKEANFLTRPGTAPCIIVKPPLDNESFSYAPRHHNLTPTNLSPSLSRCPVMS